MKQFMSYWRGPISSTINKTVLISLLILLTACVNYKPTPEGKAVKFVENKPTNCKALGKIDTTGYNADKEQAEHILRNKVVAKGGDTVRVENYYNHSMGGMVIGTNDYYGYVAYAYDCSTNK